MTELKGKSALVTGGSKGIGFGIAKKLVEAGVNVTITSRHQAAVEEAARKLSAFGTGKAIGLRADVRDFESQQKSVERTVDAFGKLDVLVANAGLGYFSSITDLTADQWNETIETNLTGVFYSIKAALVALAKTEGYIFTIASLAGTNFFAGGSAYNASKFGLVGFSQAVMLDVRQLGIKVTTIMPGSVTTNFNDHTPNPSDAWKIHPEDIGQMIVDLLKLPSRTLPSKVEVRPLRPPGK